MSNALQTVWIIDHDEVYKFGFIKYAAITGLCNNVIGFKNAPDALASLSDRINDHSFPDLIFIDVEMPAMGAWVFIGAFERLNVLIVKKASIYLLSSSINYQDILRAQNHPVIIDYLLKPISSIQFSSLFTRYTNKVKIA